MTKHTPKPWKKGSVIFSNSGIFVEVVDGECRLIADVWLERKYRDLACPPLEEAEANVNLICAAPDMYDALQSALPVLVGLVQKEKLHPDQKGYVCGGYIAFQQVRAALDKAEGRGEDG